MAAEQEVLDFWFGPHGSATYGAFREAWFTVDTAFDEEIRRRFLPLYEEAAAGRLSDWKAAPESCLALVLVLDQFPRNMFRGTPRAYATDTEALATASFGVEAGYDAILPHFTRKFLYMPYMHSERLADQERSVALFEALGEEASLKAALRHFEIIERFGRFPHRNAVLDRPSSPEEVAFLREPNSSF